MGRFSDCSARWKKTPNGALSGGGSLQPGRWHDLAFAWDVDAQQCRVSANGRNVALLKTQRESVGPSYLRVRLTALGIDRAGMLVESVSCDVSSSWT